MSTTAESPVSQRYASDAYPAERRGRVSGRMLSFRDRFMALLETTGEFPLVSVAMNDQDALTFIVEDPTQGCDFEISVSRA